MTREIVFDTETTGFDCVKGDRLIEIGAVELINHMPTGVTFHQYINPERDVPEDAVKVHGLTYDFLKDFPTFDKIADVKGDGVAKNLHCHFSMIEWTAAGEKKHLTFDALEYGPLFEPLAEAMVKDGLTPTIICESAGTQSDDALYMKRAYEALI